MMETEFENPVSSAELVLLWQNAALLNLEHQAWYSEPYDRSYLRIDHGEMHMLYFANGVNVTDIEKAKESFSNAWADIDVIKRRIAGSRNNGQDVVLVEHTTIERLLGALEQIAGHVSGGLTYFTSDAKHAQLMDIARTCQRAGFEVLALETKPQPKASARAIKTETED